MLPNRITQQGFNNRKESHTDTALILVLLRRAIRFGEVVKEIDIHRQFAITNGTDVESQPSRCLAPLSQNEHERPIGTPEAANEPLFVHTTRRGRVPRMRVNPHASEPLRRQAEFDLLVKEVRHRDGKPIPKREK